MSYKQFNNPLSRKTSPLLKTSPLRNGEEAVISDAERTGISDAEHHAISSNNDAHSVMIDGSTYDPNYNPADDEITDYTEPSIVESITGIVLGVDDTLGTNKLLTKSPSTEEVIDKTVSSTKLGKKATESKNIAANENVDRVERNIAERRGRRQEARGKRKLYRKIMPAGKERRELIKKTRENQGRKPENMV